MTRDASLSLPKLIAGIAGFVLVGFPMVGFLWETLNELLAGDIEPMHLAIALPLLLLFIGVLTVLSRAILRWEAERADHVAPPPLNSDRR